MRPAIPHNVDIPELVDHDIWTAPDRIAGGGFKRLSRIRGASVLGHRLLIPPPYGPHRCVRAAGLGLQALV